jgi:DNA-binding protein HU-beta
MQKTEILAAIAEKIENSGKLKNELTKKEIEAVYNATFELFFEKLENGNDVSLPNIGKLTVIEAKARNGRNLKTGEAMEIPAHKVVRFKVCSAIKSAVKA